MKMRSVQHGRGRWLWLALALLAAPVVHAQANNMPSQGETVARMMSSASRPAAFPQVVREIDDPHTGVRWLLMRDASHPGGPGRMMPVEEFECKGRLHLRGNWLDLRSADLASFRPIIRVGDHLTIEEHTRIADAYLEAIALGSASVGTSLNVRLTAGGKVVRAVALGPSQAAFAQDMEVRP